MRLIELNLYNYRQHVKSQVLFKKGLMAILGANGVGKSTLLEAISFVLFGEQRGAKTGIRFHWAESKKFGADLTFELDGHRYRAERTQDTGSLTDLGTGKVLATSLSELTGAIETLLGLTYDQWANSYVAEQKKLAFLNFRTNANRQSEVARMLGFDRLEQAETIAKTRRKTAADKADGIRLALGDPEILKLELATAKSNLADIKQESAAVATERETAENALPEVELLARKAADYRRLTTDMAVISGRAEGLKSALASAKGDYVSVTAQIARRTELEPRANRRRELEPALTEILRAQGEADRRVNLEFAIAKAKANLVDLESATDPEAGARTQALAKAVGESETARNDLSTKLQSEREHWHQSAAEATKLLAIAETERRQAEKARKDAEDKIAAGVCPECGQPVAESLSGGLAALQEAETRATELVAKRVAAVESPQPPAIALFTSQLAEEASKLTRLNAELQTARSAATAQERVESDIRLNRERLESAQTQLATLGAAVDPAYAERVTKEAQELDADFREFTGLAHAPARLAATETALDSATLAVQEASTAWSEAKAARDLLGFGTEALVALPAVEAAEAQLSTLRQSIVRITETQRGLTLRLSHATAAVGSATDRLTVFAEREAELTVAIGERELNEMLATEFKTLRLALNASVGPELAARASENLSLLTNGRYPLLSLAADFSPSIVDDDVSKSVISGGEEDVVALALRLALSELIQERSGRPMSLLILDEVFGSLDADRRQAVLDRLTSLKGRFEQILVISHIEGVNEVADSSVYLTRDPVTRATVVSDSPEPSQDLQLA